jgi:hypothetical protein
VEVKDAATLAVGGSLGGPLTVRSGGRLAFSIAATPAAQVAWSIAGNLTLDSGNGIDLTAAAPPAAGDYLLAGASGISGLPGGVNLPAGVSGTVTVVGGDLRLTVTQPPYTASSSSGVIITHDTDASPDAITVTIPKHNRDRLFVRLKVRE